MLRTNPNGVAWSVIIGAFAVFVALAGGVIYSGYWWLTESMVSLEIALTGHNVQVQRPNRTQYEVNVNSVPVQSRLVTDSALTNQGQLAFLAKPANGTPDGQAPLAVVTLFENTSVEIVQASVPQFPSLNAQDNVIVLRVYTGRIRVTTNVNPERATIIRVVSTVGVTEINEPGASVSVEVGAARTRTTVREGSALLLGANGQLPLAPDESGEIQANGQVTGPTENEKNLITNGDFAQALEGTWQVSAPAPGSGDPPAQVSLATGTSGLPAIRFLSRSFDYNEARVRQDLNLNVSDFTSLRILVDVLIHSQDLYNCGDKGTECPIMLRLVYLDENGNQQQWIQGFYGLYSPSVGKTYCADCALPRPEHEFLRLNEWTNWQSSELLQELRLVNRPMAILLYIEVTASGHSFDSEVSQIQLLATE
ncbi:MAG: hypothetical protein JNL73_05135 [Anaerolineales bacterium]|nr:hypothetical protein [Anaerolineales bacterium]